MKTCKRCKDTLTIDMYHKAAQNKDGKDTICKHCRSSQKKEYSKSGMRRATQYSINVDKLNYMLSKGCDICGSYEKLCVDHDHSCCSDRNTSCGECIRGILCDKCNRALGYMMDDPERLIKAAEYLRRAKKA